MPTLDESELDRTSILFSNFDTNSDGVLDFGEFQEVRWLSPLHMQSVQYVHVHVHVHA